MIFLTVMIRFGTIDSRYIRLRNSLCRVIFEAEFLLLDKHCSAVYRYILNSESIIKTNVCVTLSYLNQSGFYGAT